MAATASFGTVFNDSRTQTTDARGYVDVQYSRNVGKWDLIGRASYDWYNYHGVYIYDYANAGVPPRIEQAAPSQAAKTTRPVYVDGAFATTDIYQHHTSFQFDATAMRSSTAPRRGGLRCRR